MAGIHERSSNSPLKLLRDPRHSGHLAILGGLGLRWARLRQLASWGLVALYLAVFPANVNMAINEIQLDPGNTLPVWAMWARLPFQLVIISTLWWLGKPDQSQQPTDTEL